MDININKPQGPGEKAIGCLVLKTRTLKMTIAGRQRSRRMTLALWMWGTWSRRMKIALWRWSRRFIRSTLTLWMWGTRSRRMTLALRRWSRRSRRKSRVEDTGIMKAE